MTITDTRSAHYRRLGGSILGEAYYMMANTLQNWEQGYSGKIPQKQINALRKKLAAVAKAIDTVQLRLQEANDTCEVVRFL